MKSTEDEIKHMRKQVEQRVNLDKYEEEVLIDELFKTPKIDYGGRGTECEECGSSITEDDLMYEFLYTIETADGKVLDLKKYTVCRDCHSRWRVKEAI